MTEEIVLSADIYTLTAIKRATRDFTQLCSVTLLPGNEEFRVEFIANVTRPNLLDEFLNYVLDLSAAEQLSSEHGA